MDIDLSRVFNIIESKNPEVVNIIDVGVLSAGLWYKVHDNNLVKSPSFWIGVEPDIAYPNNYDVMFEMAANDVDVPTTQMFNIHHDKGLNSLLELVDDDRLTRDKNDMSRFYLGSDIGKYSGKKEVTVAPMSYMLDTIPNFSDQTIHFLKIDAQGVDVGVVKSMGKYLSKTMFIMIESVTRNNPDAVLYEGQTVLEDDIVSMKEMGFELFYMHDHTEYASPDADVVFINKNLLNEV